MRMRAFSFFAIFMLFTLVMLSPGVAQMTMRGDVTEDGIVDGRDALKIMLVLEELMQAPDPGDIFWFLADVYPIPGTGGRIIGDGEVTREDAEKILRYVVGLIQLGEVTGDFAGPLVTDFEPRIGTPGTRVTLMGMNFVAGSMEENVVDFGGASAPVLSATATQIETEVPPDATTGPIRVRTPGGEAISKGEFVVTSAIAGQVELPEGLQPIDFTVVTSVGVGSLDAQGNFSAPGRDSSVTVLGAVPNAEGAENVFLALAIPGETDQGVLQQDAKINARTTAETLIFCQPLFLTDNPTSLKILRDTMQNVPEIAQLEQLIEQKWPQDPNALDDPEVQAALEAAIVAVDTALSAEEMGNMGEAIPPPALTSSMSTTKLLHHLDLHFLKPKIENNSVIVDSLHGNPLDWLLMLVQVDPNDSDFDKWPELQNLNAVFDRLDKPKTYSIASAKSWYGDFELVDLGVALLFEALGLPSHKPRLALTSEDEDAVYVLRMFSGALIDHSPNKSDSALLKTLPGEKIGDYPTEIYYAFSINAIMGLLDAVSIAIDLKGLLGEDVVAKMVTSMAFEFEKSFLKQFPEGFDEMTAENIEEVISGLTIVFWKTYSKAVETMSEALAEAIAKNIPYEKLSKFALFFVKAVDVVGKIGKGGKLYERMRALVGIEFFPFGLYGLLNYELFHGDVTPLESALIVVGEPFPPKIDNFEPKEGLAGEKIALTGRRFAKNAEDNQVRFGGQLAKVISVGEKFPGAGIPEIMEMVVEVPNGVPPGEVKISAMTSKGGPKFAPKMFKMLRSPEITKITPQSGFAATDDFLGTPFPGTQVAISGDYFDPQADPPDEVYCGSQKATIEEIYDGYIKLLVPAGVGQPGTVVEVKVIAPAVKSPTGKVSESNVISFALIGVPHIDRVSPTEAKVNARMVIEGSNFSPREDEIKVCFGESIDIRARSDYNYIETRMLISIEEGKEAQMTVVTPAGPSNAVTVKRLEGFADGASITVREGLPPDPDYAEYITIERALLFAAGEAQPNDDEDYIEDPETGETISLDPPYEEEDQIHYWNEDKGFGKGYVDSISVLGELNTNITLASHYDRLFVGDITGKIELNANGCEIWGTSLPGVTITGNENRIKVDTIEGDVLIKGENNSILKGGITPMDNIEGDVRIEGGGLNELRVHYISGGVTILESMGNLLRIGGIHGSDRDGLLITQGSANNECHLFCYDNDRDGFRIDGNSHENSIGIRTYDNKGNGGTITGGANNNFVFVSRASGNDGDGIRLEGDGTDYNHITVGLSWGVGDADSEDERDFRNEGYGIAIVDGPKDNTVTGGPIGASKRGGICISNASSVTLSYSTSIAIPAIGQSLSMPGILLENGARNILIDALINWRLPGALENGIVIRGSETSNIEMSVIMMGSLHITDGAHDIRVIQSWFVDSKNAGILIDKEAHHVELIDNDIVASTGDGIIIDGAHDNLLTSSTPESVLDPYTDIIDSQGNGVIIRNGAQRNVVRWQFISNNQDGIVVSGAEDTVIEGCHLRKNNGDGILITDQAMNTTVGGLLENQHNFITENDNAGIRVSGGANGVNIYNNMIHGYFDEPNQVTGDWGIIIEGQSQNVSIGGRQLTGWNEIAKHEQGGILITDKGTQEVSMVNNYIGIQHTGEVAGNNGPGIMVTNEAGPEIFIDQNFISGNQDAGIVFDVDGMYSNMVEDTPNIKDNIIGLDPTGKNNVPNNVGIRLTGTRIGVVLNTISGNLQDGISIESGAHHNVIDRNTIQGNGRHGVFITENSISNPLFGNTITGNGQKGIALENGGNQMIEAPVIEAITPDGRIVGKILAPDVVSVEVYRDRDDEGEFYVGPGIMNKTRNRFYIKAPIPQGWKVHAIVTDENRNTSEFGPMLSSSAWTLCPAVIAFTSTRDEDLEIYMFENRQDQAERITKQNGPDHSPKVSPDLSAIAFVSERSGQPDIWLYERATEEQSALTEDPAPDYDPAWSPDGSEIAFVSERDGNPEIYVVGADGQNVTRLTNNPASDRYPCWSPNGEKIAFTSERSGNQDIWVMDADGSNPVRITDHVAADYRPNWSASRNLIAFISERDQQLKVWAAEPDGSNPRLLTPGACLDSDPAWTPEGRLLFASDRDGDWEVWVLDLDGRVWRLTVSLGSNIEPDGQFYLYGEEPDIILVSQDRH